MGLIIPKPTIPICKECSGEKLWRDCLECDDSGFADHDCGEDTCCCLEPEPNVYCGTCNGETGWYQCPKCHPWEG